ncbi:MAG: diacylglycerol/lipid kinase family protein [Christensenellaceae bacterium]
MKCIFIYNPNSGKGKTAKKLTYIVKKLKKRYASVDVYATKAKGDLPRKVAEVAEQYDCIVFSGGDGSFNEVLRGLGDRETLPLLGYIPGGTANDIAHSLGIPRKNVRKALNVILKGRRELLDCMRINGTQYAMYSISAGAFTSATYTTPQEAKRALGLLAYGLEGIRKNIPFRIFSVDATDGITRVQTESVFTLIMNSKCVAGLKMNKDASMRDGIMECAVIKQKAKPNLYNKARALLALGSLFVLGYRFREQDIERLQGNKLRIEVPDDVVWNYDGEKGASGSIEVEILSRKVPLLVPKNNKNI